MNQRSLSSTRSVVTLSVLAFVAALGNGACDDATTIPSRAHGGGDAGGSSEAGAGADCSDLPKTQGPSEACCPDYGADACGANLFCAAFDGRTVASCYPAGSRLPGKECTADEQCVTGSCNTSAGAGGGADAGGGGTGACRGSAGTPCTTAGGCIAKSVCVDATCALTDGSAGARCDADDDCTNGAVCVGGRCGAANGASCSVGGDNACASRWCNVPSGSNYGKCAPCTSDAACQTSLSNTFEVCRNGQCVHTCRSDDQCSVTRAPLPQGYTCVDGLCR